MLVQFYVILSHVEVHIITTFAIKIQNYFIIPKISLVLPVSNHTTRLAPHHP